MRQQRPFAFVVDEAASSTETDLAMLLKSSPQHIVLVGDPIQLPPFTQIQVGKL